LNILRAFVTNNHRPSSMTELMKDDEVCDEAALGAKLDCPLTLLLMKLLVLPPLICHSVM